MHNAIRVGFAILAAIVTVAGVIAVKRLTEWGLSGQGTATLAVLSAFVMLPLYAWIGWTYLLRPLIERRQQRQQPGLRDRPVGDAPRD